MGVVPFDTVFPYAAGRLVIDVMGTPDAISRTSWWPADGITDAVASDTAPTGAACDSRVDLHVERHHLVPGSSVRVLAGGPASGSSILALAARRSPPIDLTVLGYAGCVLHVLPDAALVRPLTLDASSAAGSANHTFRLPAHASLLGASFATQNVAVWLDGSALRLATSRALDVTTAHRLPASDGAVVSSLLLQPSDPWPQTGRVQATRLPVLGFDVR